MVKSSDLVIGNYYRVIPHPEWHVQYWNRIVVYDGFRRSRPHPYAFFFVDEDWLSVGTKDIGLQGLIPVNADGSRISLEFEYSNDVVDFLSD